MHTFCLDTRLCHRIVEFLTLVPQGVELGSHNHHRCQASPNAPDGFTAGISHFARVRAELLPVPAHRLPSQAKALTHCTGTLCWRHAPTHRHNDQSSTQPATKPASQIIDSLVRNR